MPFSPLSLRPQFALLSKKIDEHTLIYLDNAATTQKPSCVLQHMMRFYEEDNANINRGVHPLAEAATVAFDDAREKVAQHIHAKKSHEIIFTKNTTEAINLVARSFGETLTKGDRIAVSPLEHHSNITPWMQLRERTGIELDWTMLDADGRIDLTSLQQILTTGKTKLVAVTGLSNVLGVATPLQDIIDMAHEYGAKVLVDAAQLVAHAIIDVQNLDCDFLTFSGHKLYGPLGIGVLYGKEKLLSAMPPFLGGGDMVGSVSRHSFTCAELPRKFEAGTPPIVEAIGLGEAITWIEKTGTVNMHTHTKQLITYARTQLQNTDGVNVLGPHDGTDLFGCVSFTVDGIHPHDLTEILGRHGICLRAGHHCAQPLHKHLNIAASARLSVAAYNMEEEIDTCIDAIEKIVSEWRSSGEAVSPRKNEK